MSAFGLSEAYAGIELFEYARKQGWLARVTDIFKTQHKILVLGSTGVGKTNLLQSLVEAVPQAISHMNRTEFAQQHKIRLRDNPFIFVDTPGQLLHVSRRREAILEALGGGITGILNVVAYGYHEYRTDAGTALTPSGRVRNEFLAKHRQIELEALAEWAPLLFPSDIRWMITVVSKADLWWNQKEAVYEHYTTGQYQSLLGELVTLAPSVLEYCSVLHKFYGLGPLAGTFDEGDRNRTRLKLVTALLEAVGKSELNG